jgi:dTDP-4-dehydrorhamnose 3,5-epimerase
MPFEFMNLAIPGLVIIEPRVIGDARGAFIEFYKHSDFTQAGISEYFVQDNFSRSKRGVLRGLHYQKDPHAQGKLIRCPKGRIYDVGVDIRLGSPTYGRWTGIELSEENNMMLYVPPGFAHGFLVLSESAEVLYKCTREYSPADERGIVWNDPSIGIDWPISTPLLSKRDMTHPTLGRADNNFRYSP